MLILYQLSFRFLSKLRFEDLFFFSLSPIDQHCLIYNASGGRGRKRKHQNRSSKFQIQPTKKKKKSLNSSIKFVSKYITLPSISRAWYNDFDSYDQIRLNKHFETKKKKNSNRNWNKINLKIFCNQEFFCLVFLSSHFSWNSFAFAFYFFLSSWCNYPPPLPKKIGVLGNVMVVIVVLRSRSMRTPTNCYLVSLAVADTMVLLASVPNEIIAYYLLGDKWIWGPIGCALFIFLQYLGINASSLSIAAFTVERYIAICHPMLAHKLCTVRRAKRIILYVWMFATAYCSPWLFLTKTEKIHYLWIDSDVYTCKFKLNREHYKGYYLTDIVLFYLLPLAISCVLYALIARVLYNSNDLLKQQQIDCSARGSSSGSGGGTAKTSIDMQNDSVPFSEQNFDPSSPTSSMFLGRTKFQKNFSVTSESYSEIAGTDHSNQFQHCNESEHCSHHNQRTQPLKIRSNFRFHLPNQSYSSASMMATSGNRNNFPNSTGGIKKTLPSDSSRVQVNKRQSKV